MCAHVGVFWLLANHEGKKKKQKHNVLGGRLLTSNTSEQNGEEDSEQPRRAAEWKHTESVYALSRFISLTFLDPLLGRSGYQYECTKQEVRAGCGLVMGAGSDARVSLLLHFTKLTAHLFDLLLSCSEFNIDARLSSRSARRDGGNRNRLAQNSSRSTSLFFQFPQKASFTRCHHLSSIQF